MITFLCRSRSCVNYKLRDCDMSEQLCHSLMSHRESPSNSVPSDHHAQSIQPIEKSVDSKSLKRQNM